MFHRKYTIIISIIMIVIIGYLVMKNYKIPKVGKKTMNDNTKRLLMEYINNMNRVFNNMTRTRIYKEEMLEDTYYIEKEFKRYLNILAALYFGTDDENDIMSCNYLLLNLKIITLDINVEESVRRSDALKNIFRKIKSILHNTIKNDDLLNPLCIILAVKCIMNFD